LKVDETVGFNTLLSSRFCFARGLLCLVSGRL
jgi:hypothetical protein